jgi:hypothetical protein
VRGADAMLLCRRRRREQQQDVELDKERESGKKTGKVAGKPELGLESCYLYQNPVFPTYGSTWSERTGCGVQNPVFPSYIQFFLRPVQLHREFDCTQSCDLASTLAGVSGAWKRLDRGFQWQNNLRS